MRCGVDAKWQTVPAGLRRGLPRQTLDRACRGLDGLTQLIGAKTVSRLRGEE